MRRWGSKGLVAVLTLAVALAAGGAVQGVSIRRVRPELPSEDQVLALFAADAPVSLTWFDTASQPMARSLVLAHDPTPDEPYLMSHPAFVLDWPDGRRLLVDTGMTERQARSFGRLLELGGADALEPHGSAAEAIGPVDAVVFTHLHTDHTGGLPSLCGLSPVTVFQGPLQATRVNFTTRRGRADLACAERKVLQGEGVLAVPGFPGVWVVPVAGHTPGSQVVVVRLTSGEQWLLTGDVVNHIDGVRHDLGKPWAYSTFVVPEAPGRLGEVRRLLASLEARGVHLAVSHDGLQLEASGLPRYAPEP